MKKETRPSAPALISHLDRPARGSTFDPFREGLVRVGHGFYIPSRGTEEAVWDFTGRVTRSRAVAVGVALEDGLAVGGLHAAHLWGAGVKDAPDRVEVFGAGKRAGAHGSPFHLRYTRTLTADDVTELHGVPVTTIPRTIVEVARLYPPVVSLAVVDKLFHVGARVDRFDRVGSRNRLRRLVAEVQEIMAEEKRRPGNPRARLVLQHANGWAESPKESEARRLALVLGLPGPQCQFEIVHEGAQYFTDHAWTLGADAGFPVVHLEVDGKSKYLEGLDLDQERERLQVIERLGHKLIQVSSAQIDGDGADHLRRFLLPWFPGSVTQNLEPVVGLMTAVERARYERMTGRVLRPRRLRRREEARTRAAGSAPG